MTVAELLEDIARSPKERVMVRPQGGVRIRSAAGFVCGRKNRPSPSRAARDTVQKSALCPKCFSGKQMNFLIYPLNKNRCPPDCRFACEGSAAAGPRDHASKR